MEIVLPHSKTVQNTHTSNINPTDSLLWSTKQEEQTRLVKSGFFINFCYLFHGKALHALSAQKWPHLNCFNWNHEKRLCPHMTIPGWKKTDVRRWRAEEDNLENSSELRLLCVTLLLYQSLGLFQEQRLFYSRGNYELQTLTLYNYAYYARKIHIHKTNHID